MFSPTLCFAFTPWLWVGSYLGGDDARFRAHLAWMQSHQIALIIDLTAPSDELPSYADALATCAPHIRRITFPINDGDIPSPPLMLAILEALHTAHTQECIVYLHSWRGIGRTSMVLACWLIQQGHTASEALTILAALPQFHGNHLLGFHVQTDFVLRWQNPDASTADYWRRLRGVFRGVFLGGAVGDAIGLTNELCTPATIQTMHGIIGGGIFGVPAGTWTDDTSLMLCVADSLIVQRGFDAHDQATRYVRWWRDGYLACDGRTYDIGNVTTMALYQFIQTGVPYSALTTEHAAGTGAVIRIAPIGLYYASNPRELSEYATACSAITHAAPSALSAAQVVATLVARALFCRDKQRLMQSAWLVHSLNAAIQEVVDGTYRLRQPPVIQNSTHVVRTLESTLWSLWHHDSFADGVLALANLGGMSGAACTMYGQIAGALYGEDAIPASWVAQLRRREEIAWYAEMLLRMAWRSLSTSTAPTELFAQSSHE